jgi:2-polyprenyl-6-methoxyphenol hydroxylase-like FAD-dependent oxidoreductase
MPPEPKPVIIIGAGVAGLTLAQSLRKQNVPFKIFERDASITTKPGGWGLTIHWGLPALREALPEDILARIPETYVNKEAVRNGEDGRYQFFDLSCGEARYNIPAAERIRVSRMRLKMLLAEDLDIQVCD